MIQVTETVWLPYPENKPNECSSYLITARIDHIECVLIADWADDGWHLPNCGEEEAFMISCIIAFSELPAPYDPTATEFNFATAKRMMEGGEVCMSMASDRQFKIDGKHLVVYVEYRWLVTDWKVADIALAELQGKWRKV
jgi:hypothetical protein